MNIQTKTVYLSLFISASLGSAAAWAADQPDTHPPCVTTSFTYYTPPMPLGTVQRTPGQLDGQISAVAGSSAASAASSSTPSSLSPQDAALQFTTQLLEVDAETETETWAVHSFYDNFCNTDPKQQAKDTNVVEGMGLWLPNTCGQAYQYDVINPGRPNIGLMQQALRQDVRLIGVCALSSSIDNGDVDTRKAWLVLGLGLNEVLREGFNVGLVDPKIAQKPETPTKAPATGTVASPSSASQYITGEGNELLGNNGLTTNPAPQFDEKLSLMLQVLHETPGLRAACQDEIAAVPKQETIIEADNVLLAQASSDKDKAAAKTKLSQDQQSLDGLKKSNPFAKFPCSIYLGSVIWDVHECDVAWVETDDVVAADQKSIAVAQDDLDDKQLRLSNAKSDEKVDKIINELEGAKNRLKAAQKKLADDQKTANTKTVYANPGSDCYGQESRSGSGVEKRKRALEYLPARNNSNETAIPGDCAELKSSPLAHFIYGTLATDLNDGSANVTDELWCKQLVGTLTPVMHLSSDSRLDSIAALFSEIETDLKNYLHDAQSAYIAGDFTSEAMADDMVQIFGIAECLRSTKAEANNGTCSMDSGGNQTILNGYRRLVMIHEVVQAANGHNYSKAIEVLTRAVCTSTASNGASQYDTHDLNINVAADQDLGQNACRLLFVAQDVITAQTSADVQAAVGDFASTTGSWRYKSVKPVLWAIGGILGADHEVDFLKGSSSNGGHIYRFSVFAPVGIEWTWPIGNSQRYVGAMVSLIDVGQLVSAGGNNSTNGQQLSNNTGASFAQVWSPGGYVYWSFATPSPFVFGGGISYTPRFATVTAADGTQKSVNGYRALVFIGVDTTLFPL